MNFDQSNQNEFNNDIQNRIINFHRSGGQYSFEEEGYNWNK